MSPVVNDGDTVLVRFPRTRGDEPEASETGTPIRPFSPHARG